MKVNDTLTGDESPSFAVLHPFSGGGRGGGGGGGGVNSKIKQLFL